MQDVMRVLALALCACATQPAPLPATHPANPGAPAGRLAGPPPSIRPGVVEYKDVPATREGTPPPEHHHHGH
jgi:hypothetical protein